jgi:hypothetical protein
VTTEALLSIIAQTHTRVKNAWKQGAARSNEHMVMIAQIERTTRLDPIFCDVLGAIIEVATQPLEAEPIK